MSTFWKRVGIWIMNCFYSTCFAATHSESFLTPLKPLINYIQARYALRIVGTHPFANPASACLPPNPPIHWDTKPLKCVFPFKHRNVIYRPRAWNSKSENCATTHLPIDKVHSKLVPLTSLNKLMLQYHKASLLPVIDAPNLHKDCLTPN
jgi:hypothetical protein